MNNHPQDAERLIHEALTELGWDANATALADRVRRLEVGLPREDEFSVICGWLGQCALVHKLDQQQVPIKSQEEFQVPDLFALFTPNGQRIPVLIEVKSSTKNTLSLRPDYLQRLTNYSNLLKIPFLFAWKFNGIWILFDAKHLKKANKNFNISFYDAIKENLLGILAGDFSYTLGKGTGLHLRFRKDKLLNEEKTESGMSQKWGTVIDEVSFTDYEGNDRLDIDPQVQSLFTTWDLDEEQKHTDTHIKMSFIAKGDSALFAHMALVRLLNWELPEGQNVNWRSLLMKESIIKNIANFSSAIDTALQQCVVHHVLHQRPQTTPDFLSNG